MKRHFLTLLFVIVLASWASGSVYGQANVMNAAMSAAPGTLDPHMTTNTATQQIAIYVFEPLVAYGEDYSTILPVLAKSWEIADDGLTYTFYLQEAVRFHNGKLLTSEDVVASLDRIRKYSAVAGHFSRVADVVAIDKHTVKVALNKPVDLVRVMAGPVTWQAILPKEIIEKAGAEEIRIPDLLGTGPYKLVEWQPDVHVLLEKFDEYVPYTDEPRSGFGGKKEAWFDKIRFIPVPETGARIAGLQTGVYDYAADLPIVVRSTLEADANISPRVVKPMWALVFQINHTLWPSNDPKFRQAVLAALDMKAICNTVAMNDPEFYKVQPSYWYEGQTLLHNMVGAEYYNQADPERAKRLLKEAGYNGETIYILSTRDYDWMYRCTLAVAAQLEAAGIKVEMEFPDWVTLVGKALSLEGWHLNQSGWSMWFSAFAHAEGSVGCDAPYSWGYCNEELQELLEQARLQQSDEELREVTKEIQKIFYEDVPAIRFGDYYGLEAVRNNIVGYESWYVTPRFWGVRKS